MLTLRRPEIPDKYSGEVIGATGPSLGPACLDPQDVLGQLIPDTGLNGSTDKIDEMACVKRVHPAT